jgi:signal transduction histidine kinase
MNQSSQKKERLPGTPATQRRRTGRIEKAEIERLRIENYLRESEERLRTQYRFIPIPTVTWQKRRDDFYLVDYNIAEEESTDGLVKNLIGKTARDIHHDRPDILADLNRSYDERTVVKRESPYRLVTKGLDKYIAFTFAYAPPNLVLCHMEDVTRRKVAEERLRKSESELRALSFKLMKVEEKERKRIARELHDSIGQYLTAIKFNAENILSRLLKNDKETVVETLQAGIPLIQRTIEEVRRIMMDLRPTILDDLGIIATISWFCREFQAVYQDITVEQQILLDERHVPEPLKIIIYRIMQEAMNNAAKYSRASRIRVRLEQAKGEIKFSITDNGVGFDVGRKHKGLGLVSMRERIEGSGGNLLFRTKAGQGTMIRASWPVNITTDS